jgi:FkbM family methyltransferase
VAAVVGVLFHRNAYATLMPAVSLLRRAGNELFDRAFPIYRVLYQAYKAYTDRAERKLLRHTLFPGAVVVDAGANIGIYSECLSRCVGPNGVVHCFEPSPENFRRLQDATQQLSNVRANCAAIGAQSGAAQLYVSDSLNVDHRAYASSEEARRSIPIEMVALDDYFEPGESVDLIKLDLQGYELHALRGATRICTENPNLKLLIELWPYGLKQAGTNCIELLSVLEGQGFVIRQLSGQALIPFHSSSASETADWYVNLFAARS